MFNYPVKTLTKETFWNDIESKYPEAMKQFKAWIDKYKKDNHWDKLFANIDDDPANHVKYHDLPLAMQTGIFIQFYNEIIVGEDKAYQLQWDHAIRSITNCMKVLDQKAIPVIQS